ncbi:MAG: carbohydrate kinase [Methylococcales bacterium]
MNDKQIALFGEVLFDQFPDGQQVLGGAPFNVAWHLQAFGLKPCFISRVGCDANAEYIKHAMQTWGMTLKKLQTDTEHPTGVVQIHFDKNGEPHYDIMPNQAYDFIATDQLDLATPYSIIYHGTLALRHSSSARTLETLKNSHHGKVFVDVNLRTPWWQLSETHQLVHNADWVKLNMEELIQLESSSYRFDQAMESFLAKHNLQVLVVTDGENGATALTHSGEYIHVKPNIQLDVVDTVGAGDAFAAVLLLGLQRGWSLTLTMDRAQNFASALVTQRGAIVQDLNFYLPFIGDYR